MKQDILQSAVSRFETPAYLFDTSDLEAQVSLIRNHLPSGTKLCFAMKANPFLTKTLASLTDRLEVCSPGEYEICIREQIDPEQIVVSGVNKTEDSMNRILSYSRGAGIYTIESELHYEILKRCAKNADRRLKVLLRLSSGNQFGMDDADLERVLGMILRDGEMDVIGIHYYSGTQKKMKKIEQELKQLDDYGTALQEKFGIGGLELEYGPGLAVSYFENDGAADQGDASGTEQLAALKRLLSAMTAYPNISIELGRFLTAGCGYYMTRVMDIKHTGKTDFAIVDGGIHQIGYYGQMMGMKIPYTEVIRMQESPTSHTARSGTWTICGSLCTVNDVLMRSAALPPFAIGDILVLKRCGAYSVTEGMALFLSRELPAVLLADGEGNFQILREKRETNALNGKI